MKRDKELEKMYRKGLKYVDATEEQLNFLVTHYLDEDYIIGIHNSGRSYDYFFENGLSNQTSRGIDSDDLTNTVMCSDNLVGLVKYPNGDGKKRGNTAIILKIPKKVFTQEQGIFEKLNNGLLGIPPQFMIAAFHDGIVELNPEYDKDYVSETAVKCSNNMRFNDKQLFAETFQRVYRSRGNFKDWIMNLIRKITGRNQEKLLLPEGDSSKGISKKLGDRLAEEYPAPSLDEQQQFVRRILTDAHSQEQSVLEESQEVQ